MKIHPLFDARTWTLTYVVWDEATRDAVVIDPVLDFDPETRRTWTESVDAVEAFLKQEGLTLRAIFETHAHADHLTGAQALKARTGAPIVIGSAITVVQQTFAPLFGLEDTVPQDGRQFDHLLSDGETYAAGAVLVRALHTPGHTPACLSYVIGDAVFTGDALFAPDVGVGRCDFPGGSADALYTSVHERLYGLPPETRVFVGHDYPPEGRGWQAETSVAASTAGNIHLAGNTPRPDFVARRTARDKTLAAPRLLLQSIQVNIDAGRLPDTDADGGLLLRAKLARPTAA